PEDWNFSRQLHEIGAPGSATDGVRPLRIGATKCLRAEHRGPMNFPSDGLWGDPPYDSGWTDKSLLPPQGVDLGDFVLPEIDGWLRPAEGKALADLAAGKRVLEIGSYLGLSTVCLARTADVVYSFDVHDGRGTPVPQPTLERFRANLAAHGVDHKVIV